MGIVLGTNQYGKAETRLVRVDRDGDRHTVRDLNVSVALRGDLEGTHLTGDNATVLPTDSMKNTVYAFAKQYGVGQVEEFGLRLARHFVDSQPSIDAARIAIEEYGWTRLGPHSFARDGGETRTAVLTYDGHAASAVGGLQGLVLLELHRLRILGLPQGCVHNVAGDPRSDPGHGGGRAAGDSARCRVTGRIRTPAPAPR